MSRDSTAKVLTVAFLLCLVCAILVSAAAVGLSSRQERNKTEEKRKNILQAAGLYEEGRPIDEQFKKIQPRIVDLQTGSSLTASTPPRLTAGRPDADTETSHRIPAARDLAGIKTRSRYSDVYLVMDDGRLRQVILPVYGKGLWSTMYGFVSLADDLTTVKGFAFYEHGETPGLGGEIDNPTWKNNGPARKSTMNPARSASKC